MKNMYHKILSQLKDKRDVVLLSLFKSVGSTPRHKGAKMACFQDSTTVGTVGGGAIEYDCTLLANKLFKTKANFIKTYTLNHTDAQKLGMVCGGECSIYFQYIQSNKNNIELFEKICSLYDANTRFWLVTKLINEKTELGIYDQCNGLCFITPDTDISDLYKNTPKLSKDENYYIEPLFKRGIVYVFGGGHVSQALCPMLGMTDFRVVVYEDNEKFADKKLFPNAEKVVHKSFLEINQHINITQDDYAIVLTRGHKSDNEVLSQILSRHPSYLGVIGSQKKVHCMQQYLLNCGFDKDEVSRIHSPIGLKIKAQTPAEIAVSITAQLILHRANTTE